jgi:hypothetical protein
VAFCVEGKTPKASRNALIPLLPPGDEGVIDCWWIAEEWDKDSDNDAAVFIPYGMSKEEALARLNA